MINSSSRLELIITYPFLFIRNIGVTKLKWGVVISQPRTNLRTDLPSIAYVQKARRKGEQHARA
jgi:hypothetical protein